MLPKTFHRLYSQLKRLVLGFILTCLLISIIWVLLYRFIPIYYTPLMALRYWQDNNIEQIQHHWVSINNISKNLQLAVISAEDQKFYTHYGFDFAAIKAAVTNNAQGKPIRGASTISQQTAKNAFLLPQRSWLRKGLELWFTILIELLWSKERILEVYLNSIEMGRGVFGASAAAKHWFNTNPNKLSVQQSASIAAILPNPNKYKAVGSSRYIKSRQRWIRQQMQNLAID